MFSFLKKPYPYNFFSRREIYSNFFIGCFVALFLLIFQPFGIPLWQTDYKALKLIGFGIVSFICPIIFRAVATTIIERKSPEENWVVWKETLALLSVLLFIALGNLCYGNLIHISHFNVEELLLAMAATFLLAIFPITANVVLKYNRFVELNQKDAQLMEVEILEYQERSDHEIPEPTDNEQNSEPDVMLVLTADNEKDKLEIKPEELLYIESADNYSNVVYLKNDQVTKQLIRGSLKRLESQISLPYILRCHRSYIVNIKQIGHIKGNAQGYKIEFKKYPEHTISVSRNYAKVFLDILKH